MSSAPCLNRSRGKERRNRRCQPLYYESRSLNSIGWWTS
jgi:hypothetical protein